MSKPAYAKDNCWTVSIAGLRVVEKIDHTSAFDSKTTYNLRVVYKGFETTKSYQSKQTRDAMYDQITRLLPCP